MVILPIPTYAQSVSVDVSEVVASDHVTYHYRVINNSELPIVALRIGFDYVRGVSEITALPSGWTFDEGLPKTSISAPEGWEGYVVTTEESPFISITWRTKEAESSHAIAPGVIAEFSIVLPERADQYRTVHYDVLFTDSSHAYGRLISRS
jgi:hypothetical protein